ncbi:MAG: alkaline phosphatase family protein [Anaerolineae bacterium]|jgi:predicted AlkP superfamily phosphohydrolase/phosphomutase
MNKLLILGLDGATFDLIRPWVAEGHLPNLGRLMESGVSGDLASTLPPVTSPAWPSFMTGMNPGKHGVFDFIRPNAGDFTLVNATSIRAPTIWHIMSEAGLRVGVMNVPVTYPPQPVNGFMIGGLLSPTGADNAYPPGLLASYSAELGPYRVALRVQYKEGHEEAFLADALDLIETRGRYALRLMADRPWDAFMVHFIALDNLQHALWKLIDPTHPRHQPELADKCGDGLLRAYQCVDEQVGLLIERAYQLAGEVNVLVMSDHGFGPLHYIVNLNVHLLQHGLLRLKRRPWPQLKAALFRAGLTPAGVYRLLEKLGLQDIVARVSKRSRNQVVGKFLSFSDVDWRHTVAYSMGHVGQVYVNRRGRESQGIVADGAAYEAARERVVAALRQLTHPETGQPLLDQVIYGPDVTHGPYADQAPDLHLVFDGYRCIAFPLFATNAEVITRQIRGDSGCHRSHGIYIGAGPAFRQGGACENRRIIDLAPTILHLLGLPVPRSMDGRVLRDDLSPDFLKTHPVRFVQAGDDEGDEEVALSEEETAEIEERLRALGYLG